MSVPLHESTISNPHLDSLQGLFHVAESGTFLIYDVAGDSFTPIL